MDDRENGAVTGNGLVWRRFAFAPLTATKIAVTVTGGAGHSRIVEVEAWGDATSRPNVALASIARASASSTLDGRKADATINGDRKGVHWGSIPPPAADGTMRHRRCISTRWRPTSAHRRPSTS